MLREEFETLIDGLLESGIDISIQLDQGVRWYDLNTGMKSHLHIAFIEDECHWRGRYNTGGTLDDLQQLRSIGEGCMCGRDYASGAWFDFMRENSDGTGNQESQPG